LKFVALPVPEIIGGTEKIGAVPGQWRTQRGAKGAMAHSNGCAKNGEGQERNVRSEASGQVTVVSL